jgi:tRNA nucleotidyltransferase (CCA-adding enzyme)
MQTYLVGGAVRNQLLGLPVTEKDWVVVGSTPEEMLAQGFKPVGKSFPVFLHPQTKEEYALARTERKVSAGYKGFKVYASPEVTLEQDLQRRDLTINAIASTADNGLIDPFNGQQDLSSAILRHVSPAFIEDPVRILRLARFAATFANFGFKVAPETRALVKQMVKAGEADALVAERVWKELSRTLTTDNPEVFFQVLVECSALEAILPELESQKLPTMLTNLQLAVKQSSEALIRYAVFTHSLALTELKQLNKRLAVPKNFAELALLVHKYQAKCLQAHMLAAEEIIELLQQLDAFRRPQQLQALLSSCQAMGNKQQPGLQTLQNAWQQVNAINAKDFVAKGLKGKAIAEAIKEARIKLLTKFIKQVA